MNSKRTAGFVVAGGAIAALIASATPSSRPSSVRVAPTQAAPIDLQGAALSAEITRLRERLRPTTEPRLERNPFAFRAAPPAAMPAPRPVATSLEPEPPLPRAATRDVSLVGIAEDAGPDGPVRTAILAVAGELMLVPAGGDATPRYRVLSIAPDAVELSDRADGLSFRLVLH
jgi:hypothetical protein